MDDKSLADVINVILETQEAATGVTGNLVARIRFAFDRIEMLERVVADLEEKISEQPR